MPSFVIRRLDIVRLSLLLLIGAGHAPALAAAAPLTVGIAFDVGGKNDRSFNQAAWEGAQRAAKEFGVELTFSTPKTAAEVGKGAAPLAKKGADLVIGVGFGNEQGVSDAAAQFPKTQFVVIDDLPEGSNTKGLMFREQEGAMLGGYLAGATSSTQIIGFIGGMNVPVIGRFRSGFETGVKMVCPKCTVVSAYVDSTPAGWDSPDKAQAIAVKMQQQGADIIFAAAGGSGQGLIKQIKAKPCLLASELPKGVKFSQDQYKELPRSADEKTMCSANSRPTFFIGVDSNQNALGDFDSNPKTINHGLTSVVKRVDNAVYSAIQDLALKHHWFSGKKELGLDDKGVGYALDTYNRALISPDLQGKLDKVSQLIINGTLKVSPKPKK